MKTINININAINLVSGGGHCGCSNTEGSDKSNVFELNNKEVCRQSCCIRGWPMAHFIENIMQAPVIDSMPCFAIPFIANYLPNNIII